MKLLVFSDSHGNTAHMAAAIEREQPDLVLHLGDMVRDAQELKTRYPSLRMEQVSGNCDCCTEPPPRKCIVVGGKRIFMTHGHIYNVKVGIGTAVLAAREAGADLLLFGHTHEPLCDFEEGLWILNPGSCRGGLHPTCGVVSIRDNVMTCGISEL